MGRVLAEHWALKLQLGMEMVRRADAGHSLFDAVDLFANVPNKRGTVVEALADATRVVPLVNSFSRYPFRGWGMRRGAALRRRGAVPPLSINLLER